MLVIIGYLMIGIALLLLILSLVLGIVWKVPSLVDELSGRKARKQIERMRNSNISSGKVGLIDTDELYKSISNTSYLSDDSSFLNSSDLGKLVENPYGGVRKEVNKNFNMSLGNDENTDTELLERSDFGDFLGNTVGNNCIKIIEEQSSIMYRGL